MEAKDKVAILGDMFELGDDAEKEHRQLGELIRSKNFKAVYLCGELMSAAAAVIPGSKHFTKKEVLIDALKQSPITNSTVLVKASRGIGLETVVDVL
jgi:UDP-N-acetylmuramoyl-tripeptide--D-alanyl-D-alanine ligase